MVKKGLAKIVFAGKNSFCHQKIAMYVITFTSRSLYKTVVPSTTGK